MGMVFFYTTQLLAIDVTPGNNVITNVNVRAEPSTTSTKVGILRIGESAKLIGSLPGWFQIELPNRTKGFVSTKWSNLTEILKDKTIYAPSTNTSSSENNRNVIVKEQALKVIADPIKVVADNIVEMQNELRESRKSEGDLKKDFFQIFSGIIAAITVFLAFLSVRLTSKNYKLERMTFITVTGLKIDFPPGDAQPYLTINFRNDGKNPAKKVKGELLLFPKEGDIVSKKFSLGNEVPSQKNVTLKEVTEEIDTGKNYLNCDMFLEIKYIDGISDKENKRRFFYFWKGIVDKSIKDSTCYEVSMEKMNAITSCVENYRATNQE